MSGFAMMEPEGFALVLYGIAAVMLLVLSILWMIVPFILMRIEKHSSRAAQAAEDMARLANDSWQQLEAIKEHIKLTSDRMAQQGRPQKQSREVASAAEELSRIK